MEDSNLDAPAAAPALWQPPFFSDEARENASRVIDGYRVACQATDMSSLTCGDTRLIDAAHRATRFLHENGVFSNKVVRLDGILPVLLALFVAKVELDAEGHRRLQEWFWCATLAGFSYGFDEDGVSQAAATASWFLTGDDEPEFMRDFWLPKEALTRDQGLALTNLRRAAVAVLVGAQARDPLTGDLLSSPKGPPVPWATVKIFDDATLSNAGVTSRYDPVNCIPVSISTRKAIGGCLHTFFEGRTDLDHFDTLSQAGIDHVALMRGDVATLFEKREKWIAERVEVLIGREFRDFVSRPLGEQEAPDMWFASRGAVGFSRAGPNGTLIILPNSTMAADVNPTLRTIAENQRKELIEGGIVEWNEGGYWDFVRAYTFPSWSSAASVLSGRNASAYVWESFTEAGRAQKMAELESVKGTKKRLRPKTKDSASAVDAESGLVSSTENWEGPETDLASELFDFDEDVPEDEEVEMDIAGAMFRF